MNLLEINDPDLIQKTNLSRKLTIGGKTIAYPVYRIRLDLLFYNDKNDRIATWLTQYNNDPKNTPFEKLSIEEYNSIIEEFIIDSNPTAIEKTKNNIALVNQREPGVVLYDGRIIDGNRRFTGLRLIHREDPDVNYFETVILDETLGNNQKQIKMLELSIQHGEEQRVDYNLIDLTIGAYHDITETHLLTIQEYASSTNESIADVKKRLDIAELIIEFLDYINMPKQYHVAREMQVYSLFFEAIPVLKRCETTAEKNDLKTCIFNNIIMGSVADQRKFIRNIKHLMDEGVYESFIKRQNKIHEKIAEEMESTDLRSVKDIEDFSKKHKDLSEDLAVAMDRSVSGMKKAQSRAKPSQAVSKSLSTLADIDTDVIGILSDSEKDKLKTQIVKLSKAVNQLGSICSVEEEKKPRNTENSKTEKTESLLLAAIKCNEPFVYCCDVGKKITNLNFALEFGAFKYSEHQNESAQIIAYFIDPNGKQISPIIESEIGTDKKTKLNFTLNETASSEKKCCLVIKSGDTPYGMAQQLIEFEIDIAFSIDFGF